MIIFPAIDIMDGKPVRLLRGNFATAEQVAEDVLATAKQFARVGCTWESSWVLIDVETS